jgi:hypothetical protein
MEPFQPGRASTFGADGGEIWTRPNPLLTDVWHIFEYALTFDGYRYAHEHFAEPRHRPDSTDACGNLANRKAAEFRSTGWWGGTFEELRCCLFFEQRRWRHFGDEPQGDALAMIQALHQAICERWDESAAGRTT